MTTSSCAVNTTGTTTAAIDPTTTPAWKKLTTLAASHHIDLRAAFRDDPQRASTFAYEAGDLFVDLSKNLIDTEIMKALQELASQCHVEAYRDRMFAGEHINVTEDRAVLHTVLRRPADDPLHVDGQDCVADVHAELDKVCAFAEQVRHGEWTGVTGKAITDVVSIGIGGSDLGPVMAYEALHAYAKDGLRCHFVSNIDPQDVGEQLRVLDPETTLFIIVSKTFTTLETLTNARAARSWLWEQLAARHVIDDSDEQRRDAVKHHFAAVSTALDKVAAFGIDAHNVFGFWNWVGGRYSVDSAVGAALAVACGSSNYRAFLEGFHAIDEHFASAPADKNVPLLMGLLNVWYRNFVGAATHAVLPYNQYLHRFPAYLQQLTMESNGKRVRYDGTPVTYDTGEVFWGEPGTNGQHAFYQLIHQGTQLIPADFIAFANTAWPLSDNGVDQHELFLGNFFAQTKALAFGKTVDEVRAEGTPEHLVSARVFPGNRPTTSIMAEALDPRTLGELIALYEHITFVEGAIWGIDSFDQWGVELGKALAKALTPAIAGDKAVLDAQDASTKQLIEYYHRHRHSTPFLHK